MNSCQSPQANDKPVIEFTHIPPAGPGGPVKVETIEGRVKGAKRGQRIVLFAKSGQWWVQLRSGDPYTTVRSDSTWTSSTHLGTEYAALLVDTGYDPPLTSDSLPALGHGVVAEASVEGLGARLPVPNTLRFSGYDWEIRDVPSDRGGTTNDYDPTNVWMDANGWLHLRVVRTATGWSCAELSLRRSLGYGSYRFVVRDLSHFEPALAMGMYTWDVLNADQHHREIDIEISQWGDPSNKNAQYVVQPYYVPANVVRFSIPSGRVTQLFRWQPGRISFQTIREAAANSVSGVIEENVFTSGVPEPGGELLHLNLYVYGKARIPMEHGAEVIVEKFEYLP